MNHDNDREALGFLVIGAIIIVLGAVIIGLLSCHPIGMPKPPAAVTNQPVRTETI